MRGVRSAFGLVLAGIVLASSAFIVRAVLPRAPEPEVPGPTGPYPVPEQPSGPLEGLVVYLSAGHGYKLHRRRQIGLPFAWGQQRSRRYGMVEDEWTADYVSEYLAPAIEEAGGTVIALRERDRNPLRVISDDAHFSARGVEVAHRVRSPLAEEGGYTRLEPNGMMVWWMTVPTDGHWYLYSRWNAEPSHDPQAIFTVHAGGTVRRVVVDQREHGGHWWPLADLCLFEGDLVEITLTGSGGGRLAADAVRMGGGRLVFAPEFDYDVRNHLMYDVAMPHQVELLGAPRDLPYYECGNPISDMRLRPVWASWAHPEGEQAVYLSIHTNAAPRGRAEGLTVFAGINRNPWRAAYPESVRFANLLEEAIHRHVREHDRGYRSRGARLGDYSEISPEFNELPGALIELGFHDNPVEVRRLTSHTFKVDATDGIVEALEAWHRSSEGVSDGAEEG